MEKKKKKGIVLKINGSTIMQAAACLCHWLPFLEEDLGISIN